jgi:hypothetical protein
VIGRSLRRGRFGHIGEQQPFANDDVPEGREATTLLLAISSRQSHCLLAGFSGWPTHNLKYAGPTHIEAELSSDPWRSGAARSCPPQVLQHNGLERALLTAQRLAAYTVLQLVCTGGGFCPCS